MILCGPGLPDALAAEWSTTLASLRATTAGTLVINRGWDLDWERRQWVASSRAGDEHVSVRIYDAEVIVGPRWVPGSDAGCAGCAEVRERTVLEHPLLIDLAAPRSVPRTALPMLVELLSAALGGLDRSRLGPGELYAVGDGRVRRHRVPRSFNCPVCAHLPFQPDGDWRPDPVVLHRRPADPEDPARSAEGARLFVKDALRDRLVDDRYGPVRAMLRDARAPFAMSMAVQPDSAAWGYGRAITFAETEPVAILEVYERLGGFPFDSPVVVGIPFTEVSDHAVSPTVLGQHTEEQLAHPSCKVMRSSETTPFDWVWGTDLRNGDQMLVPAEIGFFQYEYRFKLERRIARTAGPSYHLKHFHESSSGCAAGANLEEAALHSLFELAERDAFLISWHRAEPLPCIEDSSITDPECQALLDLIHARGFDTHVLVATQDIELPIFWVLAVNRTHGYPASFSSGGSGANPSNAIRGALREVAQLVTMNHDWDRPTIEPMFADPWLLEELEQHPQLYALPETLPRVTASLGGARIALADAFPDWPDTLRRAGSGDVRGSLDHVRGLFAAAGLEQVVLVDQSTREHRDIGVAVAKAVVPGITSMCFGHAQQRLLGLPRLTAALAGSGRVDRAIPYDPHPFP